MFNTTYFNMYESREESSKVSSGTIDSKFCNIEKESVIGKKPGYEYSELDQYGLIKENTLLDDKKVIIGKVNTNLNNPDTYIDSSITPKKGQLGFVDKSFITEGEEGFRIAKVRIREERIPAIGDKFCSRCGQKGTIGLIIPEDSMPFTEDGIRPDLIINPHALPSRMTIGQLVETLMGKTCAMYGGFGDCTAFVNKGPKHEIFGTLLKNIGYNSTGNEILYSGETGEQLQVELFIGPCYYMRLKHMVKDKINYRAQGPRTALTRQTVQGRANDGGLRIGEMERDCIIAHGATKFLNESMLKRGDEYFVAICNSSGTIAIYNESKNIFISPFADGPLKFNNNIEDEQNIEVITKYGRDFSIIRVPYSFKLLMQELQVMNIQMRIITEDNIEQLTSMNYKNTLEIMKDKILDDKQKTEFNKIVNPTNSNFDKIVNSTVSGIKNIINPTSTEKKDDEKDLPSQTKKEKLISQKQEITPDDDDDDDNEGLSPVTIEAIRKAEEDFEKNISDDSDEEEEVKPTLTIGQQVTDALNTFVQTLSNESSIKTSTETPKETSIESSKEISTENNPILKEKEKEPEISILDTDTNIEGLEENSNPDIEKKKTIQIE